MKKIIAIFSFVALFATFAMAQAPTAADATKKTASKKKVKKAKAKVVTTTTSVIAPPAPAAPVVEAPKGKGPMAEFIATEIDYGTITKGGEPLRKFKFKNVGTEPLIIKDAKGSCGCTVPSYSKEPVAPGATSEIEVRYDTQRVGPFSKSVTLTTNEANETRVLSIKGEVKDAAAPPPTAGQPANH
ncbi:MAG: hypothetical protein RLZZ292_462 [Bacteroidota bacterium]|jgi:hypothetical protein